MKGDSSSTTKSTIPIRIGCRFYATPTNVVLPAETDPAGIPFPCLPQDGLQGMFERLEDVELRTTTTATAAAQGAEVGAQGAGGGVMARSC